MSVKTLLTADDLWEMPEVPGKRLELVNGELVEMPGTGGVHGLLVGTVFSLLRAFVRERNLGAVFADGTSYVLRHDPALVRVPDVSFVARARIPADSIPVGFIPLAPDLVVEIVSPSQYEPEVMEKVQIYLEGGVKLIWVVYPRQRQIREFRPGASEVRLGLADVLDGRDLLPGFRLPLATLFRTSSPA